MPPRIVGLTGRAGAGKTTVAHFLEQRGWVRLSFAAPLKRMMIALYHAAGLTPAEVERRLAGDLKEAPDPVLRGASPRRAMQTLGTEWGRACIAPDLWCEIGRRQALAQDRPVVFDDCRFAEEAAMIRDLGGLVALVEGRAVDVEAHPSESVDLRPEIVLPNLGTVDDLLYLAETRLVPPGEWR